MPPKRYVRNKEEKIQLIFQTFAELVNKNGYDKLSTRHIAEAANISVGTIYYHFPGGKHTIANGFLEHVTHQLFDPDMFEKVEEQNLPDLFEDYIRQHLTTHRENLEIHRAIDQAILANREVFQHHQEAVINNFKKVVKELKGLGMYKDLPEPLVLQNFILFFNLIEAVIHRHLFIHPFFETDEELVRFLGNLLSSFILANELGSSSSV